MLVMDICHYLISSMSLLGLVAIAQDCMPVTCLNCNSSHIQKDSLDQACLGACESTNTCISGLRPNSTCIKDFPLQLKASSMKINAGEPVNVSCEHNLTLDNIKEFIWLQDNKTLPCKYTTQVNLKDSFPCKKASQLTLDDQFSDFNITCKIHSRCGNFTSDTLNISVTDNSLWILFICGGAAIFLILIFTLGMKLLLKRDIAQRQTRKRQNNVTNHTTTTTTSTSE
ncbi:uncharacterized protein LOC143125795 [Alosa pseudoharengus]|uniref:uncharacterized protein LOC143125795 n=1 Tax=Alosa pseudoharengus TaxID=34774 RepID=UPI003F88B17C